jgi:hypothetical protein
MLSYAGTNRIRFKGLSQSRTETGNCNSNWLNRSVQKPVSVRDTPSCTV